jgi:putative FmdB family regulatory protein
MPLYDYRCSSCGDFRAFRPMAESSAAGVCPTCGEPSERLIATPFLAGGDVHGSTAAGGGGGHIGFRHACGHGPGCSHSH